MSDDSTIVPQSIASEPDTQPSSSTPQQVGHKRRWLKAVIIVVVVIVLLGLLMVNLPRILGWFVKDSGPISDVDLMPQAVSIPAGQNAYDDLIKLKDVIYWPTGKTQQINDMLNGSSWDTALENDLLSRNVQALALFAAASEKSSFQDPEYADPSKLTATSNTGINFSSFRQAAKISAIRALSLARQGKDKEAIEEAFNCIRVGDRIGNSQGNTIMYLVSVAMKENGIDALRTIVATSKLSNAELRQYNEELVKYYDSGKGLVAALKIEYYSRILNVDAVLDVSKNVSFLDEASDNAKLRALATKSSFYFEPNKTKAIFASNARDDIKNVGTICSQAPNDTAPSQRVDISTPMLYFTENAVGRLLSEIGILSESSIFQTRCKANVLVAATSTLIALKEYKNDTNNYPTSLEQLVPQYLTSVPFDNFGGKPLHYSVDKKIVYSVGVGGQDVGGSTGTSWRSMTNPTFSINF